MKLGRFWQVSIVVVAACTAAVDAPVEVTPKPTTPHEHPQPKEPLTCSGTKPGPAPIRRLTRTEYDNTVRDLFGDTTRPASTFVSDGDQDGFDNNAAVLSVAAINAEQYMRASEGVAERATSKLDTLVPCRASGTGDATCVRQFIRTVGQRVYRGAVSDDEVERLYAVFAAGQAEDFRTGIELVLQTMLQSSRFLYRVEFGQTSGGAPGSGATNIPLTSWEMASRLSYLMWNSMPDDALFAEAAADRLTSKEQVLAQAKRMLADTKTQQAVGNFMRQWLGLDALASVSKSSAAYPAFSESIRAAMRTETEMFLDDVLWHGAGDLTALLSAPYSFMNGQLASYYGVRGPAGAAFERVSLDGSHRGGILTHASLLAINAHSDQTSPVTRGKFIRERFFCQVPPPPPPTVKAIAPDVNPMLTTRERFAEHSKQASCATCHKLMDPIGLGFENYDGVGQYRSVESGKVVDSSGELFETDVDGAFSGVPDLVDRLLESQDVRDCVVTEMFRFGYGRSETDDDECNLRSLEDQFDASKGKIADLLLALTQSDAFLYRPAVTPGTDASDGGAE